MRPYCIAYLKTQLQVTVFVRVELHCVTYMYVLAMV